MKTNKKTRFELFKDLVNQGKSRQEIIEILNVSSKTIQRYKKEMLSETSTKNETSWSLTPNGQMREYFIETGTTIRIITNAEYKKEIEEKLWLIYNDMINQFIEPIVETDKK